MMISYKKCMLALALCSSVIGSTYAEDLDDKFFTGKNPKLTAHEKAALAIAKGFQVEGDKIKPFKGREGKILFIYGAQQPSVVCAVLQVCDIVLQPGESVTTLNIGDSSRWSIDPAMSGSGATARQHLVIKPLAVGLETSLLVTTDRRAYHIKLRSHRTQYMPYVGFTYPSEVLHAFEAKNQTQARAAEREQIPETGEYLSNLDFDYRVTGANKWKPSRVYNDGQKTIIEMPEKILKNEAPTLLLLKREKGFFRSEKTALVNYRLQGNRYIVDDVFEKAVLIAGVGKTQERVTIIKEK